MGTPEVISKTIPINRIFPEELQSHFVEHFVVQQSDDHFVLSFFEVWPPVIVGTKEEKLKTMENLEAVNAKCVARLVLTPKRMQEIATVIQANLKKSGGT